MYGRNVLNIPTVLTECDYRSNEMNDTFFPQKSHKKSKKEEEKCFIFVNFVGALFFHAMQRNAMQRTLLLKLICMGRAGEEENKLF